MRQFDRTTKRVSALLFAPALCLGACAATPVEKRETPVPRTDTGKAVVRTVPYAWRNVRIVAGGFVDGIVFHPTAKDVAYLRTDMGGAYRWEPTTKEWTPITDWVNQTDWNLHGIESLAMDPRDPNRIYLAAGTYTNDWAGNASMLRSFDRGKTWKRTDMPFKMGGNEDGRSAGERLAVDPHFGKILYFGSRHNGLWKSEDEGATWKPVASFPVTGRTNGVGTVWIVFDPTTGSNGKPTPTLYAGVQQKEGPGVYVSRDSGATWSPVAGQPAGLLPHQAQLDTKGDLYITYGDAPGPNGMSSGAVYRWNTRSGQWSDISPLPPKSGGFAGLSLDRKHPGTLVVSTMDRWGPGDDIFRTIDGGKTWVGLKDKAALDPSLSPFLKWGGEKPKFGWWMGAVAIDPFRPERIVFATGATIWESKDLTAADTGKPTHWAVGGAGVEQTAVIDLVSPSGGAPLLSALGDIGGFRHDDLTISPSAGMYTNPMINSTQTLDVAARKPEIVVRGGDAGKGQHGAISYDNGVTWKPFASEPQGVKGGGVLALSADGRTIVWSRIGITPAYTTDGGATWKSCEGLPPNARVVGDTVNPERFYALEGATGRLLASNDGGAHFTEQTTSLPHDDWGGRFRAVPGFEGYLYITAGGKLFRTTDGGKTCVAVDTIDSTFAVGFGKAAPGKEHPAIYLIGKVGGIEGIFRSDDTAASWVRINDDQHQFGPIGPIVGDPRIYGRVYLGSNGRGVLYADPVQ